MRFGCFYLPAGVQSLVIAVLGAEGQSGARATDMASRLVRCPWHTAAVPMPRSSTLPAIALHHPDQPLQEAGEVDQQWGLAEEPVQPLDAAAAKEEEEQQEAREWARRLSHGDQPAGGEDEGGKRMGAARQQLRRLGAGAASLGRRLSDLRPAGLPGRLVGGWPAGAAAVLLALALLCGPLAAQQARASGRELAALRQQVDSGLDTAAAARAKLSRQLAEVQRSLEALDARQAAAATRLQALQASCKAQAGASAELGAKLAAARADLAGLQAATAAAAAEAAAAVAAAAAASPRAARPRGSAASTMPAATQDEEMVRQLAREEVGSQLDLFAADRTGQPDWALAAAGAAVVAHSPAHGPPPSGNARLGAIRDKLGAGTGGVHPQATKASLAGVLARPVVGLHAL